MLSFLVWFAIGSCGAIIFWASEMQFNAYLARKYPNIAKQPETPQWCPTPRALIFGSLASCLGPFVLLLGIIAYAMIYFEYLLPEHFSGSFKKWFTTPICK